MKCWKCNQEIGTGGCACDRIRCTLASWSVSATPDNSKTDRIAELEAEIEKLKAEQIDMLLHPEKYFSIYRHIESVLKRAERLEAENAALKAERDAAVKWMDEYRSKTYCAYCGATFDIDEDAFNVSEHIRTCPHHPMREVEAERDRLKFDRDLGVENGIIVAKQALRGEED